MDDRNIVRAVLFSAAVNIQIYMLKDADPARYIEDDIVQKARGMMDAMLEAAGITDRDEKGKDQSLDDRCASCGAMH